jgi:hypothetical protein
MGENPHTASANLQTPNFSWVSDERVIRKNRFNGFRAGAEGRWVVKPLKRFNPLSACAGTQLKLGVNEICPSVVRNVVSRNDGSDRPFVRLMP